MHVTETVVTHNTTLCEAALVSGKFGAEQFESVVEPVNMIGVDWRESTTRGSHRDAEKR